MVFRSQYVCGSRPKVDCTWPDGMADTRDRVYLPDYTTCHVFEHIADKWIYRREHESAVHHPLDRNLVVFIREETLRSANKNFFRLP